MSAHSHPKNGVSLLGRLLSLVCGAVVFLGPAWVGSAARAQAVEWIHQFGTNFSDEAVEVDVDGAGSVYVAGHTGQALPGQSWVGGTDAFVRRYDAAGNEIWTVNVSIVGGPHLSSAVWQPGPVGAGRMGT